jgi:predicted RNA-binding protein with PUA-like domain
MRDQMRVGDYVLFYHSSTDPAGVAGLARVASEAYPDPTQFDAKHAYHDPTSKPDAPRWMLVDLEHVETFDRVVSLAELREDPKLEGMLVLRKGQRLSVQPVATAHFKRVIRLAEAKS